MEHLLGEKPPENYLIVQPTDNPRARAQRSDDEQPGSLRVWPYIPFEF